MADVTYENYQKMKAITRQIDGRLNRVWEKTAVLSNTAATHECSDFQDLVAMGDKIIPYVIHHGMHDGWDWIHLELLGMLSGERPCPDEHAGKFYHQVNDWLGWYLKSKYNKDDPYYGLID
jgi:hypothetical protein